MDFCLVYVVIFFFQFGPIVDEDLFSGFIKFVKKIAHKLAVNGKINYILDSISCSKYVSHEACLSAQRLNNKACMIY